MKLYLANSTKGFANMNEKALKLTRGVVEKPVEHTRRQLIISIDRIVSLTLYEYLTHHLSLALASTRHYWHYGLTA